MGNTSIEKPSTIVDWMFGVSSSKVQSPGLTKIADGWDVEKPPFENFNYIFQNYGNWQNYLNNILVSSETYTRLGIGRTALSGTVVGSEIVALGTNAGHSAQGSNQLLIGIYAGADGTYDSSTDILAIGNGAGRYGGSSYLIAIGTGAGQYSGTTSGIIAIGQDALKYANSGDNIAIGKSAGAGVDNSSNNIGGSYNLSIGLEAGYNTHWGNNLISLGYQANKAQCGIGIISIGYQAGYSPDVTTYPSYNAMQTINIGSNTASNTTNGGYTINIGPQAGSGLNGGASSIFIGWMAGLDDYTKTNTINQNWFCIGTLAGARGNLTNSHAAQDQVLIGNQAGYERHTGGNGVGIGYAALYQSTADSVVAIGKAAGHSTTSAYGVFLGDNAGYQSTGNRLIAIGKDSATTASATDSVFLGENSGFNNSGSKFIGIGYAAGSQGKGANSINLGELSGFSNWGAACIAIGQNACSYNSNADVATDVIAIGHNAWSNEDGSSYIQHGDRSIAIGYRAGAKTSAAMRARQSDGIFLGTEQGLDYTTGGNSAKYHPFYVGLEQNNQLIQAYMRKASEDTYQYFRINSTLCIKQVASKADRDNQQGIYSGIGVPLEGMMVFVKDPGSPGDNGLHYYDGTTWYRLTGTASP